MIAHVYVVLQSVVFKFTSKLYVAIYKQNGVILTKFHQLINLEPTVNTLQSF